MSQTISKYYLAFLTGCGAVAGIMLGLMGVLVSIDVVMRNLGGPHLPWLLDSVEYAMYLSTFIAAPWALRLGAHVRVDLLLRILPPGLARLMELLADAIGIAMSLVLVYYGFHATWSSYAENAIVFKYLVFPEWWMLWVIPTSASFLALEFSLRLIRVAKREESVIAEIRLDMENS